MTSPLFPGLVALGFFLLFKKLRSQQENNDTDSSIVPLPSPPASVSQNRIHNVFPSFHGEDVRKSLLSHILASFERKSIYPFIDNEIDRGNPIGPELKKAIGSSKVAIVLLSKNYASSSWCLDELAEIIDCKKNRGQTVIPIFYEVNPTDVKKQAGNFGKAFKKTCKGKTKKDIEKWKNALTEVATIAGEHSHNWSNEAAMIEKIATDVFNKLTNSTPSKDLEYYVGMRAHMERMESLLSLNSDEVRMIGIWGPPGIGKKTIGRVLFNQLSSSFQLSTIMVDVKGCFPRLCFDEYNVQLQLQNQMLSHITNQDIKISHLGVAQELLKNKKMLLVINDVDHPKQLDALAGTKSWFGSGSRIIVTTEDRSLLKGHDIDHIYKVKCPSRDEAFQIFCMHAFREKHPPDDGFYKLAKEVSELAGELPLGLEVLGSALRGYKSKQDWEMILPRLRTSLHGDIESIIKFSYDALCDDDKYLFLYLSCFFIRELVHKVEEILASQFPNVKLGLHILTEKSLIFIEYGRIYMHDLIEQFGRETARKKFVRNGITKREILVDDRDICEVLTEDTITDSNHLIGIYLNWKMIEENINISDKTLKKMADLQFIDIFDDDISPCESELRSLFFHSQKIRSLIWFCFGNICLPSTFNTEFLVNLELVGSKLEKLWEGDKVLKNLKWMKLSHSKHLKELPDLSTATNLEELNLSFCENLVELPDLPTATKLRKLDLSGCSSLVKLPSSFGNFNNLEKIHLSYCGCLVELPFYIGTATNLQKLDLTECSSLVKLPSSLGNLINLEEINLEDCSSLLEIPFSIGNLQKLKWFLMRGCSKLEALPTNINLESLFYVDLTNCLQLKSFPEISTNIERLYLTGTAINEIPLTIMLWPRLSYLNLKDCNNLVSLPQFPDSLRYLDARNCKSLERLDCTFNNPKIELEFGNCFKLNQEARDLIINTPCNVLKNLKWKDLSWSKHLKELPDLSTATKLEELDLDGCKSLVEFPDLPTATKLRKLDLSGCSSLVKLPSSFGNFNNLEDIDLTGCLSLVELPFYIGTATNLQSLDLTKCSSLVKLPWSIGNLTNLEKIKLERCSSLVEIPFSIGNLQKLTVLNMKGCSKLEALPTNINLESLSHLDLTNCSQLKSFPEISTNLEEIKLEGCSSLVEIPFSIENLQKLKELRMKGCSKLEALPTNINLESLITLYLSNCSQLKSFPEISTNIEDLYLTGTAINEIPLTIVLWPRLWKLNFMDCNNLVSLPQFPDSVRYLDASNCKSLERLDGAFCNPEIELLFSNCFKLNQKARDLIINTPCKLAVLPGKEVPACFNYCRGTGRRIRLNESTHPTSLRFKVCITLVKGDEETTHGEAESSELEIDMMVKQNDHIVPCRSSIRSIHEGLRKHIYIFEVEAEEVTSTELVLELKTKDPWTWERKTSRMWKIGEWGLMQI